MHALLTTFSWQELRHHPWRNAAAALAVMLGVALAFSVQLINASALDEFSSAVRSVNGQPDLELRAAQGGFDEAVYARVARQPQVLLASPVLELQTVASIAFVAGQAGQTEPQRVPLRIVGIDALVLPTIAPALLPRPSAGSARFALFAPSTVFLNAAARAALGEGTTALRLSIGGVWRDVHVAGTVAAGGNALAVMDIGAAQDLFGRAGHEGRDTSIQPHLIILDMKLVRLHGLDVLKALRKDPRTATVPVVMHSSSTERADIAACYANGANSYVRKATDYDDLRRKMRQIYDFWVTVNERSGPANA